MQDVNIAILRSEDPLSAGKWIQACNSSKVPYVVIDLTVAGWLEKVLASGADMFLLSPSGMLQHYKTLYDERIYIICKVLKLKTFPTYEECYIYENKRLLSYYLQANNIPYPKTWVFYDKEEANVFVEQTFLPLVAKTATGASGSGVQIIRDKVEARKYIKNAFSKKGIRRRFGPNRVTGSPGAWLSKAFKSPYYFVQRMKQYFEIYGNAERGFVIFQEYIPHDYEWRVVKIGDSYFARKKVKYKDMASGTKGYDYVNPPFDLLDFTKELCDKNNFNCMAVDLFEDGKGGYLVNELQTQFGQAQDHIMEVDGKTGRYFYECNQWVFEEGKFNDNQSYDLRLEAALKYYRFRS